MRRCIRCVMPDTRPDTAFVEGVCSACLAYEKRPEVDWVAREMDLKRLLERFKAPAGGYDCIVASSGGKDSTYQVLALIAHGARPLVVTARTCQLTPIGRANIDNLARYAPTLEVVPNMAQRAQLNRIGLEMVGDISWPEHVAIFTTPFRIACMLGVGLVFYGENPQNQYGGPLGSEAALQLTKRWRSEYGGFLGLRIADVVPMLQDSILTEYTFPTDQDLEASPVEAHFLGQYIPWDSHRNAEVAEKAGMRQQLPCPANYWKHENLDNAQTGIHDHVMYRKYGYGRGCAQVSVDVRAGRLSREEALAWVEKHDGEFPTVYAGVHYMEVLERLGMSTSHFSLVLNRFTNKALFDGDRGLRRPPEAI